MVLKSAQSYCAMCIILPKDFDPPPTGPVMKANLAYSAIQFSLSGNELESIYLYIPHI